MIAAMDKVKIEVIVAIILGLLAGTLITMGITGRFKNLNFFTKKTTSSISLTPSIATQKNNKRSVQNAFLEIENPQENFTATFSFELKGKTNPKTEIIISTEQEDKYLKTDTSGKIKETLTLWPGKNLISILTLNLDKNITKEIEMFYFPEK